MEAVAILILDGVEAFALSAAYNLFTLARRSDEEPIYRVRLCAKRLRYRVDIFDLQVDEDLSYLERCSTLIIPSIAPPDGELDAEVLAAVRAAARRGVRIGSICTGAFVLAEAGLLNGVRATLSWRYAEAFARRYREVEVEPNRLFIDAGQIVTSGPGVAAIDMCLHLIRQEQGAAVAARTAREAALPAARSGEQAQILPLQIRDQGSRLVEVTQWMLEHLRDDLSVETIAERAGMSTRTLRRRFFEQTRTTPKHWLAEMRVRRAQQILETSDASVEAIARDTGFRSSAAFRERFSALAGMSPTAYRAAAAGVGRRSGEPG